MKREPGKGGRGVPDLYRVFMSNFTALHVAMVVKMDTKAAFFVRFFMGGYMRRLGLINVPLSVPSAFNMPELYRPIQTFFKKCGLEGEGAGTLTSHRAILSFVQGRDPVCPVRGLALGQAEDIWSAVTHPDLLRRHKDLAWMGAHEVVAVRAIMHARRLSAVATCPRNNCPEEETVRHLVWGCAGRTFGGWLVHSSACSWGVGRSRSTTYFMAPGRRSWGREGGESCGFFSYQIVAGL